MAMGTEANKGPRVVYALCPCYVLLIAKKRFLRVAEFAQGKHCRVPRRSFAATRAEIDSLARGARAPRWPTKTSAVSLPPRAASLGSLMPPLLRHPSVHAAHHAALLTRPHTACTHDAQGAGISILPFKHEQPMRIEIVGRTNEKDAAGALHDRGRRCAHPSAVHLASRRPRCRPCRLRSLRPLACRLPCPHSSLRPLAYHL
eukprot:6212933-Pleurochrysis_carterae.AAC.3